MFMKIHLKTRKCDGVCFSTLFLAELLNVNLKLFGLKIT